MDRLPLASLVCGTAGVVLAVGFGLPWYDRPAGAAVEAATYSGWATLSAASPLGPIAVLVAAAVAVSAATSGAFGWPEWPARVRASWSASGGGAAAFLTLWLIFDPPGRLAGTPQAGAFVSLAAGLAIAAVSLVGVRMERRI